MKIIKRVKKEVVVFGICVTAAMLAIVLHTRFIISNKDKETSIAIYEVQINMNSIVTIHRNNLSLLRGNAEEILNNIQDSSLDVHKRIIDIEGKGWELLPSVADTITQLGRITGKGTSKDISKDELREIYMAEKLNKSFQVARANLSNSPYFYYSSQHSFWNLTPRIIDDFSFFVNEYLDYELFTLGLPENNKDRTIFWTKPYIDAGYYGVTVTVGTPLYHNNTFLGTICTDIPFNNVSNYLQSSIFEKNQISIVDNHNQIVASSIPRFSRVDSLQSLNTLINYKGSEINQLEMGRHFWFKNNRVFISPLPNTKWFIVHTETKSEFYYSIAKKIIPVVIGVILILVIIYFLIYINRLRILNQKEKEKAEIANATKNKFLSIIAHDLRSPFASIIGFSDLLLECHDECNFKDREEMIEQISISANNTFQLLNNLLDWANTQTDKIIFKPERYNLEKIFIELIEQTTHDASEKEIEISYLVMPDVNVVVDINMFRTILRNLVSNAIKFTRRCGKIEISAEKKDTNVIVSVSDSGVGMNSEKQKDLFDLTKNTTTLGTEDERGTGFGLILCNEFVTKHGGKIWVKSKEGVGSTFLFEIPLTGESS